VHPAVMPPRRGPKPTPVTLTRQQREQLEALLGDPASSARTRVRVRIVLAAAEGKSNGEVMTEVGCSEPTVIVWRRRFAEHGMAGLVDAPPGPDAQRRGRALAP